MRTPTGPFAGLSFLHAALAAHLRSERAASLVEYALLIALIALVLISAVTFLGGNTSGNLNRSSTSLFG
ncbi:MAG: Flp family type IVb pilin [Microthrixaceae bacterium]